MVISNHNSFQCCLIKLLLYVSLEKYIYILALEMASPGNQQCASCIGTLSFLMVLYLLKIMLARRVFRCGSRIAGRNGARQRRLGVAAVSWPSMASTEQWCDTPCLYPRAFSNQPRMASRAPLLLGY